jgi:hypothetical protein
MRSCIYNTLFRTLSILYFIITDEYELATLIIGYYLSKNRLAFPHPQYSLIKDGWQSLWCSIDAKSNRLGYLEAYSVHISTVYALIIKRFPVYCA